MTEGYFNFPHSIGRYLRYSWIENVNREQDWARQSEVRMVLLFCEWWFTILTSGYILISWSVRFFGEAGYFVSARDFMHSCISPRHRTHGIHYGHHDMHRSVLICIFFLSLPQFPFSRAHMNIIVSLYTQLPRLRSCHFWGNSMELLPSRHRVAG